MEIKALVYDRYWNYEEYHTWNVSVAKPDLIAYSASVSDTTVDPGQSVTVYWTSKNQGTGSAGSTQQGVMWSSNSAISRSDTLLEKEYLGSMSVNETSPEAHTINIPMNATPGQTYYLGAYADYDLDEDEGAYENNNGSNGIAVSVNELPKPDLIVQDISISPSSPTAGQNVTITVTLKNQGNADADAFDLKYYVDGSYIGDDRCSWGLDVGDSDDESISYTVSDSGNHTIKVFVDSGYEINEGDNENNNTLEETYYWSIPTGSLIVRMYNTGGAPEVTGSGTKIQRYDPDWNPLDDKQAAAVWSDIPTGTCHVEAYYTGTFFGEEFWASSWSGDAPQVNLGQTTTYNLVRMYPYATEIKFYNDNTSDEIAQGGTVVNGTTIRMEVTVQNDVSENLNTRVRLLVDRNQAATYDKDETSSSQTINADGDTAEYVFYYTPSTDGSYYRAWEVETYVNNKYTRTDSWPWGHAFNVIPDETATITDAKILNSVDNDQDGYSSSLTLEWYAKIATGNMSVYAHLYADSWDAWERDLGTSGTYTISTSTTSHTFVVPVADKDLSHNTWDFQIDLFDASTDELVASLGMGEDPDLDDVKVELPSEDGDVPPILNGKVAYHSYSDYENWDGELYLLDLSSHSCPCISSGWNVDHAINPHFSPDGSKILFMAVPQGQHYGSAWEIYLWTIADAAPLRLTNNNLRDEDPKFCPNGQMIVFKRDGSVHLMKAEPESSTNIPTKVTANTFEESMPFYTKDGTFRILYSSGVGEDADIRIVDEDGTNGSFVSNTHEGNVQEYYPVAWYNDKFLYTRWDVPWYGSGDQPPDQVYACEIGAGQIEAQPELVWSVFIIFQIIRNIFQIEL